MVIRTEHNETGGLKNEFPRARFLAGALFIDCTYKLLEEISYIKSELFTTCSNL